MLMARVLRCPLSSAKNTKNSPPERLPLMTDAVDKVGDATGLAPSLLRG
jgi:hypothetical protein